MRLRLVVVFVALILSLSSRHALAKSSDQAVPIKPDSVEGQNVNRAIDFLRTMGEDEAADQLAKRLANGNLYMDPSEEDNGDTDTTGWTKDTSVPPVKVQNPASPTTPFDPDRDFEMVVELARILFHENIHANQWMIYWGWKQWIQDDAHERDAWGETILAMDRWIVNLRTASRCGTSAAERVKHLKKIAILAEHKREKLRMYIGAKCYGADCQPYKLMLDAIVALKEANAGLIRRLQPAPPAPPAPSSQPTTPPNPPAPTPPAPPPPKPNTDGPKVVRLADHANRMEAALNRCAEIEKEIEAARAELAKIDEQQQKLRKDIAAAEAALTKFQRSHTVKYYRDRRSGAVFGAAYARGPDMEEVGEGIDLSTNSAKLEKMRKDLADQRTQLDQLDAKAAELEAKLDALIEALKTCKAEGEAIRAECHETSSYFRTNTHARTATTGAADALQRYDAAGEHLDELGKKIEALAAPGGLPPDKCEAIPRERIPLPAPSSNAPPQPQNIRVGMRLGPAIGVHAADTSASLGLDGGYVVTPDRRGSVLLTPSVLFNSQTPAANVSETQVYAFLQGGFQYELPTPIPNVSVVPRATLGYALGSASFEYAGKSSPSSSAGFFIVEPSVLAQYALGDRWLVGLVPASLPLLFGSTTEAFYRIEAFGGAVF